MDEKETDGMLVRSGGQKNKEYGAAVTVPAPFFCSSRLLITVLCFLAVTNMMCLRLNMSVAIVCMVNHTYVSTIAMQQQRQQQLLESAISENNNNNSTISNTTELIRNYSRKGNLVNITNEENPIVLSAAGQPNASQTVKSRCGEPGDVSSEEEEKEDGPLLWNKSDQSHVLAVYFYAYVVSLLPSGWIVRRVGGKRLIFFSSLAASVTCLCIPIVAVHSVVGVVFLRVLTGLLGGVVCPAVQNVLKNWSPPHERSTMGSFTFAGFPCGTLLAFTLAGLLCQYGFAGGWPSVFYVFGMSGLAFTLAWLLLVSETPESHTRIGKVEREFIRTSLMDSVEEKKHSYSTPWKGMLTSLPVYAILVTAIATDFVNNIFLMFLPTYLSEIMHFKISSNGVISSLPYVVCFLALNSAGYLSDLCIRTTRLSTGAVRRICASVGHILCVASLIIIGFIDCDKPYAAVALLIVALVGIGCMTIAYFVSPLDIAPEYSGLILAVVSASGNAAGAISGTLVGAITSKGSSLEQWRVVFLMSAAVAAGALVFYLIFASGNIQPWARPHTEGNDKTEAVIVVESSAQPPQKAIGGTNPKMI